MKRSRLKFAWKILFDRKFRCLLVDTIKFASSMSGPAILKHLGVSGASDTILLMGYYSDIVEIAKD